MRVGELVSWKGRDYVLQGFDPMSARDLRAELDDPDSGTRIRVPVDELEASS
jgi:hypothetical protein